MHILIIKDNLGLAPAVLNPRLFNAAYDLIPVMIKQQHADFI